MMAGLKESQHLTLPFKEIEVATQNFLTCIGKGGYGEVYKGELVMAGKPTMVAVKRLNEKFGQGLKEFLTEVQLLTGQEHPNLISLLGYCDEGNEKIIVYEYAERRSLDRYIRPNDTTYCLTWLERLKICVGAARGLDHLHSHVGKHQSIIHRDIKSANILLDDKWVAKISDLGLSKLSLAGLDRSMVISHACGTPGYYDPEYITSGIVTKKSDVYSFGMVLFEVLCGRLCTIKDDNGLLLSAKLVKDYYQKSKLEEIVHPILRKQMSTFSMHKFSGIAYKCLHDDREQRPLMDVVKKELEEMLKIELSPSGYLAIEGTSAVNQPVVIQPISIPTTQKTTVTVVKVDVHDDEEKRMAMKALTRQQGVESIAADMKDKKFTITGVIDLECIAKTLEQWHPQILTVAVGLEKVKKFSTQETVVIVVKVKAHDNKETNKAIVVVSTLPGFESIDMDMKDKKLTIIGVMDPVLVVRKLRKWHPVLLTVKSPKD
ncbi:hypothetical protein SSX86_013006 [Deinandra increscens subsp. villosa]|uniref:Uncharacterized protein n=1 Tax=Deinandra increscens subsp. villosa TaxID=3103831 RepID=A0AAP0D585_9ASTR